MTEQGAALCSGKPEVQYEIRNYTQALLEPLWEPDKIGPTGKPKRNKSKLKQQRASRRRNRK